MPYISTERVAQIRKELKETFPYVKFSVRRYHGSTVQVSIMESPYEWGEGVQQINPYYLRRYKNHRFLSAIKEIANAGNYTVVHDGDYGAIPKFYLDIEIGKWDRPHVKKGEAPPEPEPVFVTKLVPGLTSNERPSYIAKIESDDDGPFAWGFTPDQAIEKLKIALG